MWPGQKTPRARTLTVVLSESTPSPDLLSRRRTFLTKSSKLRRGNPIRLSRAPQMNRCQVVFSALLVWATFVVASPAQMSERAEPRQGSALNSVNLEQTSFHNRMGLPPWIELGAELRGRAQSGSTFDSRSSDRFYLNRLQLNLAVQPRQWVRFVFQGQDARVFGPGPEDAREDLQNTFDVHQAYADFGRAEQGWRLRAGRQELAFGDERLLGADNYWDCFGQTFDAVRLSFAGTKFRFDTFSAFRVRPARRRWDPLDRTSRISGLSAQIRTAGEGVLEPYFLWKRGGDTLDLMTHPGHRDVLTPGVRAEGSLPHSFEYNIEMALQRGHVVSDEISAWAGHWELGWKPFGREFGLRLGAEYNYASGDRNPTDGRYGTFDDLYPAGFSEYGMEDPIAWRNIRYPAVIVEIPVTKRWTFFGGYRRYWLASIQDGLYPGGDEYLIRNSAAAGADVGSHTLVSVAYAQSERWQVHAGYGHLSPGSYLRQSGFPAALRTAYLQSSFTF